MELASFILWALLTGIFAVALYANIGDRYGAGRGPTGGMIGLVESVAATVAGAWLYRPAEACASAAAA